MIVGVSIGGVGLVLLVLGLILWVAAVIDRDCFASLVVMGLGRFAAFLGGGIMAVGGVVYAVARWNM
jgi:hypothetical protein